MNAVVHDGLNPPIVRQRWMFTDLPFLPVGTNCVLMNRVWNGDTVSVYDVGMKPPATANYHQDARYVLPPNFHPTHICHDEWLSTGEPWPNDLPPTLYDDYWIPFCCGPINHLIGGGVEYGGPVYHSRGYRRSPAGGLVYGGPVYHLTTYRRSPGGGVEYGGEVLHVVHRPHSPGGGVEYGGEVLHQFDYRRSPAGGVVYGGPVYHLTTYRRSPAGGVEFGGEVLHLVEYRRSPAGGVEFGGEVLHLVEYRRSPAGGVEYGGEVLHVVHGPRSPGGGVEYGGEVLRASSYVDPTAGGYEIGGQIGDVYTPGTPVPGPDCASAAPVDIGVMYNWTPSGSGFFWFKYTLASGVTYHIDFTGLGFAVSATGYMGGSCPFPSILPWTLHGSTCADFTTTSAGTMWLAFSIFTGGSPVTFKLSTGSC